MPHLLPHLGGGLTHHVDRQLEAQADRLNLVVQSLRLIHRGERQAVEDAESMESDDSLAIGRHPQNLSAAVAHAEGLHPFGAMLLGGQIGKGGGHAACADCGGDRLRYGAFIEALATLPGHSLKRGRQLRQPHQLARLRGAALRQHQFPQLDGSAGPQQCGAKLPEAGDRFTHRIALAGVGDHRLPQLLQRLRAKALQQRAPAIHSAGDRDGGGAVFRHHRHGANAIEAGAARGPTAAIQPKDLLLLG